METDLTDMVRQEAGSDLEDIPFPSVMRALMGRLGEEACGCRVCRPTPPGCGIRCSYAFFIGVTGVASFLNWKPGWQADNVEIMYMSDDLAAPFDRAFQAAGYAYQGYGPEASTEQQRLQIMASIQRGRPVIAFGPIGRPEGEMIRERHGRVSDYLVQPSIANDDTAYQVLALHAVDEHGTDFSSEQLALEWVEHLPHAFTAEWVALENIKAGMMPPESGWFRNPCAEWVGSQMRSEVFGLLAPMRPDLAASLAFRDAIISHRGEGLVGGIFCAVLISVAFSGRPAEDLLSVALSWVPAHSRFRRLVEATMSWCADLGQFDAVLHRVEREVERYHWIHTLPNIAAVVAGLCLGEGDFERSMLSTLHCGFDTDCSTGQTAALLGTVLGYRRLPERWTTSIGDSFQSYVIGFETMSFDELAAWTVRCGRRVLGSR